jgi:hypothetical protein
MSRKDYTTLWVRRETVTKLNQTAECGTAKEKINRLLDDNTKIRKQLTELKAYSASHIIIIPCSNCGAELAVSKGDTVHQTLIGITRIDGYGSPKMRPKIA